MFLSCVTLVFLLRFLDFTVDYGWAAGASDGEDRGEALELTGQF